MARVGLIEYELDGTTFEAAVVSYASNDASNDASNRRPKSPTVLVFHGMEGRGDAQVAFATRLTQLGFAAIAVDLFGKDASKAGPERCAEAMSSLMQDRQALRDRLTRVVDVLVQLPDVDRDRVAAVGFCFGGLCVLDLARSGYDVRGVASFHGVLTPPDWVCTEVIVPKVIVFHGWDDPYATPDEMLALGRELSGRGADWQIHAFGATMHAFMAPAANNPAAGIQYNELSATRAWKSLGQFLGELF